MLNELQRRAGSALSPPPARASAPRVTFGTSHAHQLQPPVTVVDDDDDDDGVVAPASAAGAAARAAAAVAPSAAASVALSSIAVQLRFATAINPEFSFAANLQRDASVYASYTQYCYQKIHDQIGAARTYHELLRWALMLDELTADGTPVTSPVFELAARVFAGLTLADASDDFTIVDNVLGEQQHSMPLNVVASINKARLQSQKLSKRNVSELEINASSLGDGGGPAANAPNSAVVVAAAPAAVGAAAMAVVVAPWQSRAHSADAGARLLRAGCACAACPSTVRACGGSWACFLRSEWAV